MSSDTLLAGNRFQLYRMASGAPQFICLAVNLGLTETKTLEDATSPDCDNPLAIPADRSVVKMTSWSLNFGGKCVMSRYVLLRTDFKSEAPVAYRIVATPIDNVSPGQWDGNIHITSLEIAKSDSGIVTLNAQAKGDGDLTFLAT